jgi:predicted nucleic acid-binding protein
VLFDTKVVLDLLLDRQPFAASAVRLIARVESRQLEGLLGGTTVTTIHYLLSKELGRRTALDAVRQLLALFAVAPIDARTLSLALDLPFHDFEDAVLHEAARLAGADRIVTRNRDDFRDATLPVHTPDELESILETLEGD